ncbi:biopolymer transporter ExbD [Piscinibacter sp. Jin2]|uniref:Biopolymer transporter ExbD n=1 Tax=Aquariibacter lacus TaxID=2801332 RepID=A0A9X0XDD5_9BURK|nr:biopolymer transporter ExbD [Piscinibacter lacus]MBL0718732.1 biopolymer transporter ExbD [Piscinibacter lacus]
MPFGRLERRASARPMSEINMTPLIDVMLVLLVVFLVSAPLLTGRLGLKLPSSEAPPAAAAPQALRLSLDAQGGLRLNEAALDRSQLAARLAAAAAQDPATEVHLQADRAVPYGEVAGLIDTLQQAGLSRIAFVTQARP